MKISQLAARLLALSAGVSFAAMANDTPASDPQINQIQVIGTHNSYQLPADPRVMALFGPALKALFAQSAQHLTEQQRASLAEEHPWGIDDPAQTLDYMQLPIEMQLRMGVRSLELDLQPDPEGGRYADPLAYRELRRSGKTDLAPIYETELRKPGMKVFHLADLDFRSQCPLLRQCLQRLREWSDANPGHSPVFILLEPKLSGLSRAIPGAAEVPPFDAAAFAEVDEAIRSVIGNDRLFTPDQLRGRYATLEEAARAHAWPRLSATRGKFIFLYLVPGLNFAAFQPYLESHASLEGRAAFVQGVPGMAHTAFVLIDNATARPGRIEELVRAGYLVRSRADIDTGEARRNIIERRDRTLASGAQIISTDYLTAPNIHQNGYHVPPFPDGWRPSPAQSHQ